MVLGKHSLQIWQEFVKYGQKLVARLLVSMTNFTSAKNPTESVNLHIISKFMTEFSANLIHLFPLNIKDKEEIMLNFTKKGISCYSLILRVKHSGFHHCTAYI